MDTTYYWRVETLGNGPYSPSGWSTTCGSGCSFTTALAPAPAPVPLQLQTGPGKNGKFTNDFTPGLRWQEIALPGGTSFTTYEVEVSTDPKFLDHASRCFLVNSGQVSSLQYQTYPTGLGLTTAQFDTGIALAHAAPPPGANCPTQTVGGVLEFQPTTAYYWHVRAQDSGGTSDWSSVSRFSTTYAKVDSGTGTFAIPAEDAAAYTITFSWTMVGSQSYRIQACTDPNFNGYTYCPLNAKGIISPYTWHIPAKEKVAHGILLYWHVRAEGTWGDGLWSDYNSVHSIVTTP